VLTVDFGGGKSLVSTTTQTGTRIELVSMDPHFHEISIGLYQHESGDGGTTATVHTYSSRPGSESRLASVAQAMCVLGGLELVEETDATVRFSCGDWHAAAAKRTFLEACKADPAGRIAARPLRAEDPTTGQDVEVERLGDGAYRILTAADEEGGSERAAAVAGGFQKLLELLPLPDDPAGARFPCDHDHDAVVGLLLVRALNLRAVLREEEANATRGILLAPSAQKQ
jgi:hypothetical protein